MNVGEGFARTGIRSLRGGYALYHTVLVPCGTVFLDILLYVYYYIIQAHAISRLKFPLHHDEQVVGRSERAVADLFAAARAAAPCVLFLDQVSHHPPYLVSRYRWHDSLLQAQATGSPHSVDIQRERALCLLC